MSIVKVSRRDLPDGEYKGLALVDLDGMTERLCGDEVIWHDLTTKRSGVHICWFFSTI